jgi:hypothetical protein
MPLQPPSFGSRQYWDDRFTSNSNPFEWLEAPTSLDPFLVDALRETADQTPEILHIGCGTSLLSYHLRAHVQHPNQIHNLDYSEVAVQVGKKRELEIFNAEQKISQEVDKKCTSSDQSDSGNAILKNHVNKDTSNGINEMESVGTSSTAYMRWSSANLLSHASLLNACKPSTYSVIVDKSTSDSIACSDDIYVPLPYPVSASRHTSSQISWSTEPVHPIHILAIHLALVAKPKARWIALSYSNERFPFLDRTLDEGTAPSSMAELASELASTELGGFDSELDDDLDDIPQDMIDKGLPDPKALWKLVGKVSSTRSSSLLLFRSSKKIERCIYSTIAYPSTPFPPLRKLRADKFPSM